MTQRGGRLCIAYTTKYSDTPRDPHSPTNHGIFGLAFAQLHAYQRILVALIKKDDPAIIAISKDFDDFEVSWVNRKKVWLVPYVIQVFIACCIAIASGASMLGIAYFTGIMSHPFQGWLVNALGHAYGYQNFKTGDHSRNNTLVAWMVAGEGYQNNHHHLPGSPKFSVKWWEVDFGFGICRGLAAMGLISIQYDSIGH